MRSEESAPPASKVAIVQVGDCYVSTGGSKREPRPELKRSRIADGRDLIERRRRVRWIRSTPEVGVARQIVHAIGDVERFNQRFELDVVADTKRAIEPQVQREKVAPDSRISRDEVDIPHVKVRRRRCPVCERSPRRSLQTADARRDVER